MRWQIDAQNARIFVSFCINQWEFFYLLYIYVQRVLNVNIYCMISQIFFDQIVKRKPASICSKALSKKQLLWKIVSILFKNMLQMMKMKMNIGTLDFFM